MAKYGGVASASIKKSLWCAMFSNPREWRNYFKVRDIDLFGTKQMNIPKASNYEWGTLSLLKASSKIFKL